MAKYLFYTVGDDGEPSEVIGKGEGTNSKKALSSIIMDKIGQFDQPLTNVEAVCIQAEYSTKDISDGKV